ncbi:hypothetical protein BGZ82_009885 [Podila clonocystis]|nr:hypothetical protein BGZ82_009885 [Podila clonocystis]
MDYHSIQQDDQSWPRLSSPPFSSSRPAPRWTPIIPPSQVLVFPQFLSVADTRALLHYIQAQMATQIDAHSRKPNIPRPGYAFRDNDRISIRSPEFAQMLWNKAGLCDRWFDLWQSPKYGLETVYGESVTSGTRNNKRVRHAVGLSSNIRFYRYQTGQSFGAHYDESVVEDPEEGTVSEYTVLIYLNGERDSDLLGGETVFYPRGKKPIPTAPTGSTGGGGATGKGGRGTRKGASGANSKAQKPESSSASNDNSKSSSGDLFYTLPNGGIAVKPDRGLLLVHRHGDECMLHEALLVNRGYKYVLRTDVVYEP